MISLHTITGAGVALTGINFIHGFITWISKAKETFPIIFQEVSEDCRRFPKISISAHLINGEDIKNTLLVSRMSRHSSPYNK